MFLQLNYSIVHPLSKEEKSVHFLKNKPHLLYVLALQILFEVFSFPLMMLACRQIFAIVKDALKRNFSMMF